MQKRWEEGKEEYQDMIDRIEENGKMKGLSRKGRGTGRRVRERATITILIAKKSHRVSYC